MATNVVVIDSSFRKVTIKVTAGKFLSEVLEEACTKFKVNPSNYGLKNGNKSVNLSLPYRQTGLAPGAKLNLVVVSKTPVPIAIALQLPQYIQSGERLKATFPSNTTLWLVLRKFESSGNANLNFTQRGVAEVTNGSSGSGRIYFERPVLNVMGRELSEFTDLQKTLGQLGCTGSALVRLDFKKTDQPLDEAMVAISEYFKEDEPAQDASASTEAPEEENMFTAAMAKLTGKAPVPMSEDTVMKDSPPEKSSPETQASVTPLSAPVPAISNDQVLGPDGRPIAVYRAPSNSVPAAALAPHNEADYEPTIAHAKMHNSRLQDNSHNKRLPSDAEAEQIEKEKADKLKKTTSVTIRLRFPDQTKVDAAFDANKTGADLYIYVTGLMAAEKEPFKLTWFQGTGAKTIPRDGKKLIKDLGFMGSTTVNFVWGDDARESVRKVPTLKPQYIEKAKDVSIPQFAGTPEESSSTPIVDEKGKGSEGEAPKKKGLGNLNRFVKGLSKK